MDINLIPYFWIGWIRFLPSGVRNTWGRSSSTPNITGIEGPEISASIKPTLAPDSASAIARLEVTVDLPTPPLPEATAIIFLMPPKTASLSARAVVTREVMFTVTSASLSTIKVIALIQALRIKSFNGQAGVVRITVNDTCFPLIWTFSIIFKVTKSLPRSGSST